MAKNIQPENYKGLRSKHFYVHTKIKLLLPSPPFPLLQSYGQELESRLPCFSCITTLTVCCCRYCCCLFVSFFLSLLVSVCFLTTLKVRFTDLLSYLQDRFVSCYLDQSLTPTGADNPLAEFALYHHRRLQASVNQTFQGLSVKECAQFCLQVTREHMFNCSSFEHVTTTRNCLLTSFSCQQNTLSFDSSRDFYQLKG